MNIGIVGCNSGASAIIDLLSHDPAVSISFVYDRDPDSPGIILARTRKLLILNKLSDIKNKPVDVLLNLTGSVETGEEILELAGPDVEVLGTKSAEILSAIIDERRKRLAERGRAASEREVFRSMGRHIEKIDNMRDAGFAIIDYAKRLGDMEAGVLSYYDEEAKEMVMIASNGLEGLEMNLRWAIDDCAATAKVVARTSVDPETFDAFELEKSTGNHFTALGVKLVIAVPLVLDEKVHSILYLCDFEEKAVLRDDIDTLALMGIYGSLIMDKLKILEKMRHLIITDALTGLSNKRSFMEQLEKEFQRSARYGHSLSIVIFEVDDFKDYIEEYGHIEGNELIREISGLVSKSVRSSDTGARYGSVKFSALLCEIPKEGAFIFAQRLVESIANHSMPNKSMTVSAGVATFPKDANSYMALISKAEGNLHKAKEWGKNRACS